MAFNELMNLRKYLTSACERLTALEMNGGINTFSQWKRFSDSWNVVAEYMRAHPELP